MKKITLGLIAASLIFLGGCAKKEAPQAVIKVNGRIITENMFKKTFDLASNAMFKGEMDFSDPQNKFIYLMQKNGVVNELIIKELIQFEAEKRQLTAEDKEINSTVDEIVSKLGQEKFESLLVMSKLDKETFRDNIKLDILKRKLVESVAGDHKVSEEDVKNFYEENKERFKHGEQVRAAHILISASEDDIKDALKSENPDIKEDELNQKVQEKLKEAQAKAQDIQKQAKNDPEKFAELAKKYSQDLSNAENGGDLGFFQKSEMVKEFDEVAFSVKPGEISDVVKTQFGYHIVKVLDRKEAGVTPIDEIADKIKMHLDGVNKMEALKKLIETSRQSANITYLNKDYNPDNIKAEIEKLQEEKKAPKRTVDSPKKPEESSKKPQ